MNGAAQAGRRSGADTGILSSLEINSLLIFRAQACFDAVRLNRLKIRGYVILGHLPQARRCSVSVPGIQGSVLSAGSAAGLERRLQRHFQADGLAHQAAQFLKDRRGRVGLVVLRVAHGLDGYQPGGRHAREGVVQGAPTDVPPEPGPRSVRIRLSIARTERTRSKRAAPRGGIRKRSGNPGPGH